MKFRIMGKKGDVAIDYDLEAAELKFNELKESNLIPFEKKRDGKLQKINDFNSKANELYWLPRITGG